MNDSRVAPRRFLMLGPSEGWHAGQLRAAAKEMGHQLDISEYETVAAKIRPGSHRVELSCSQGELHDYDAILTRTMPAASMERITFRLAALHAIADGLTGRRIAIVNSPRALEWSIDKFACLARLKGAGYPVPPTRFVQSRREAMEAYEELGADCVVKPVFGGEGRGVMRITDPQLAWTCFSTLDQLDAMLQIQTFVSPGGKDTRLLVVGDRVYSFRRENSESFRSNVSAGARCLPFDANDDLSETAIRIARLFGLVFASVDVIDNDDGPAMFLEVNAIPGWRGAQAVKKESIAAQVIATLASESERVTT